MQQCWACDQTLWLLLQESPVAAALMPPRSPQTFDYAPPHCYLVTQGHVTRCHTTPGRVTPGRVTPGRVPVGQQGGALLLAERVDVGHQTVVVIPELLYLLAQPLTLLTDLLHALSQLPQLAVLQLLLLRPRLLRRITEPAHLFLGNGAGLLATPPLLLQRPLQAAELRHQELSQAGFTCGLLQRTEVKGQFRCQLQEPQRIWLGDNGSLTNFPPPDHEGRVVEELLLILSTDHLSENNHQYLSTERRRRAWRKKRRGGSEEEERKRRRREKGG
ncbi:hypothetical protein EYF80_024515 [Liparis tanakae]|uniref:Uncharacterized protein n=1 Tax=Liparis tanakae TaxID=230148 RepID=A0A4Z2HHI5_9TELE|nr:hypothetical protein EYF80_024515 [Liparis tanakae]